MPCLKPPKREGECAPSVRKGRCWVALHWAGTTRATSPLDGDARTRTTEPEETKHPILQRRYLFSERPDVRGWQDSRAVHDSRGPCSEKCPFLARSSRGAFPKGDLRGVSDAWRAYLARASPFSDAWRANLAANWRFFRPRPLSGCMERKTCHGLPPGNAFREHFSIGKRTGTHRGRILPRIGTWGGAPHEYIATASQAKSASGRNPATVGRWETHFACILPTERHLRAGGPIALP